MSPPVTTMREGITENSQIRTICQVGQRAGDAGCSPGGWHSEHGDDTPRYHSQARPAQSQATRGSIPAVQASQRAACALRDALAQQAHTGVQVTHGTRPHSQSSTRLSIPGMTRLARGRVTFSTESGTSLVVQWIRICLAMQGTWVQSLVLEGPTCCRATKPMAHNYWVSALEPGSCSSWDRVPQPPRPCTLEAVLSHRGASAMRSSRATTKESARSRTLEKAHVQQQRPSAKNK